MVIEAPNQPPAALSAHSGMPEFPRTSKFSLRLRNSDRARSSTIFFPHHLSRYPKLPGYPTLTPPLHQYRSPYPPVYLHPEHPSDSGAYLYEAPEADSPLRSQDRKYRRGKTATNFYNQPIKRCSMKRSPAASSYGCTSARSTFSASANSSACASSISSMSEIDRQVGQESLDVLTLAIPGDKANDREGMAKVMQPWLEGGIVGARYAGLFKQALEDELLQSDA